jgi:hypothetical protein
MAKVGQVVAIPTGSYCNITLDSGEKIIVNHEPGGPGVSAGARLTVDRLRMMGFSSQTVVTVDLESAEGKAAFAQLAKDGPPGAVGSPLRAFVAYIQKCATVDELVARCRQLLQGR